MSVLAVVQGDITKQVVDAVVNAANTSLLGGGGVDGAIHRAAGPRLLEECRELGRCPTGEARLTKGYALTASFVIHTPGPVWNGGRRRESELLAACYTNSLLIADQQGLKSIAFPCISTGVYRFPADLAAQIAVSTVKAFLENARSIEKVVFVCFSDEDRALYEALVNVSAC